jgi:hypothetical protein
MSARIGMRMGRADSVEQKQEEEEAKEEAEEEEEEKEGKEKQEEEARIGRVFLIECFISHVPVRFCRFA